MFRHTTVTMYTKWNYNNLNSENKNVDDFESTATM